MNLSMGPEEIYGQNTDILSRPCWPPHAEAHVKRDLRSMSCRMRHAHAECGWPHLTLLTGCLRRPCRRREGQASILSGITLESCLCSPTSGRQGVHLSPDHHTLMTMPDVSQSFPLHQSEGCQATQQGHSCARKHCMRL